jgi:alginate O-acetyltransferase complex protein AlgI
LLFTELRFLVFFALVFCVHWALRSNRTRKLWLLGASYVFYAGWDWRFLSLIWLSTCIDYLVGHFMPGRSPRVRRTLLITSLAANLGILGTFKYYDFFVGSAARFSEWLGLPLPVHALELVLPLGISFYTFQTLSYSIDVYRGRLQPTRSAIDFALFVAFFPQLVAGPIVRASELLPQLLERRRFTQIDWRAYLLLFLSGFIKKACVADNAARVVDLVFADPAAYGVASKWLASGLYSLQIYCDFSGYSDMAIASAGMLGYRLADNFAAPYLATSMRDFWRRWHISLSTWFRDYLYIPLGGNRATPGRVAFNLFCVFLLCGLWHGAAWTFVVWGAVHGVFLALERRVPVESAPRWLGRIYALGIVNLAFVIFRSPDFSIATEMITGLFAAGAPDPSALAASPPHPAWWGLLALFALLHTLLARRPLEQRLSWAPDWLFALGYGAAIALALPWMSAGYRPFIYFQF